MPDVGRNAPNETHVQSVCFYKSAGWTEAKSRAWCKDHDYYVDGMDETDELYRWRQYDPEDDKFRYRNRVIQADSIFLVLGFPKGKSEKSASYSMRLKIAGHTDTLRAADVEAKRLRSAGKYEDAADWHILGVPFGGPISGRDLDGEAFHSGTDIWLNPGDVVKLTYYHGLGPDSPNDIQEPPAIIGEAEYIGADERGHWFGNVKLDHDEKLAQRIIEAGVDKLRASSGAIGHLVRIDQSGMINTWPVGELALFDINEWRLPANDFDVIEVRDGGNLEASAKAEMVEALAMEAAVTAQIESKTIKSLPQEVIEMSEEIEAEIKETPAVETVSKAEFDKASERVKSIEAELETLKQKAPPESKGAPTVLKTGLGDSEIKAFAHFVRTGRENSYTKASNPTDMGEGSGAAGLYSVPTGHFQGIVARRDEGMLARVLGVRNIPGKGLTVNVPLDAEDDGEFVSTNEAATFDKDTPALGQAPMTLVKYTKQVPLSVELLEDEDSRLLAFLEDFVGRGMAKTHNGLLVTEVTTNGSSLKTFGAAAAYTLGDLEGVAYGSNIAAYLDDSGSVAWVTSAPNYSKIAAVQLTGGARAYTSNFQDQPGVSILGYPVKFSNKVAAAAASAKSLLFGNWNFVGMREAPGFEILRDPYSLASKGQVVLHYYFRVVYKVLQAEAIGYGIHPTA